MQESIEGYISGHRVIYLPTRTRQISKYRSELLHPKIVRTAYLQVEEKTYTVYGDHIVTDLEAEVDSEFLAEIYQEWIDLVPFLTPQKATLVNGGKKGPRYYLDNL